MTDYERGVEQASNIYREVIREYVAENAKLREERDHWRVEQVHAYGNWEDTYKRASELEAENAKLREQSARLFDKTLELGTENAKLREQIYWLKHGDTLHVLTDQELADQQKHEREVQASITALESENAKLRELARIMHSELVSCEDNGYVCGGHKFDERVRELGIEVSE